MIKDTSNLTEIQQYIGSTALANYNIAMDAVLQTPTSTEHIELALNTLCFEIESLRRELVKSRSIFPLSAPFRCRVYLHTDKIFGVYNLINEVIERWPGLVNGKDKVNADDLAKDLAQRIKAMGGMNS